MVWVRCGQRWVAKVEAIVFDKDGTLADSRGLLHRTALARATACATAACTETACTKTAGAKTAGAKATGAEPALRQALLNCFGVTAQGIDPDGLMAAGTRAANQQAAVAVLTQAGHAPDRATALVAASFAAVNTAPQGKAAATPPFAGTAAMLERLHQSPLKLGVLSSDSPAYVEDFLRHYDLMPWVHAWQGTGPQDVPKPDPALLRGMCDRIGVLPQHTLIVGDSWADQALADQAGAAGFISVSEPWGRPPLPGAQLVLRHWHDLAVSLTPPAA